MGATSGRELDEERLRTILVHRMPDGAQWLDDDTFASRLTPSDRIATYIAHLYRTGDVVSGLGLLEVDATLSDRFCGCTADAELGAGSVCPECGHRDHGRKGCRASTEPGPQDVERLARRVVLGDQMARSMARDLHRLLMPPHPDDVYSASALCSCGGWQYDADSAGSLTGLYRDVLRDHTAHVARLAAPPSPAPGLPLDALKAALTRVLPAHAAVFHDGDFATDPSSGIEGETGPCNDAECAADIAARLATDAATDEAERGARPMGCICEQGDGLRFHALNCPVHGIDAATDEAEREWSKSLPKDIR